MQWEVEGANRETGEETVLTLEAENGFEAEQLAVNQGMLVADVRQVVEFQPKSGSRQTPSFLPHWITGAALFWAMSAIGSWQMGVNPWAGFSGPLPVVLGTLTGTIIVLVPLGFLFGLVTSAALWSMNGRTREAGVKQCKRLAKFGLVIALAAAAAYFVCRRYSGDFSL